MWCAHFAFSIKRREGMDATEEFICRALRIAENGDRKCIDWLDVKEYLEGEGLSAPYDVIIEWDDYTFVDGYDYDGEDSPEKACFHSEEERAFVDCKYCSLIPPYERE